MSFMAVAYVPSFLEDRATFIKERANGLYGASAFMIANFLIGIPYLCTYSPPSYPYLSTLQRILICTSSPYFLALFCYIIFLDQPSTGRLRLLYLGHVAFPRPIGWRIFGGVDVFAVS